MKAFNTVVFVLVFLMAGCAPVDNSYRTEQQQVEMANQEIINNQPAPNLGGWSFERHIVTEVYKARNRAISTYTYMIFPYTGQIVEVCASVGYPIPYSTQLTSPERIAASYIQGGFAIVTNPEPNGLYPPDNAVATIVNCTNPDGTVTPVYVEDNVMALPYRIQADRVFEREEGTESSLKLSTER